MNSIAKRLSHLCRQSNENRYGGIRFVVLIRPKPGYQNLNHNLPKIESRGLVLRLLRKFTCMVAASIMFAPIASLADSPLVIRNVDILDVETGSYRRNQNLIVQDGLITKIGASDSIQAPDDSDIIDASGRILMPGLTDAHAHLTERDIGLFLANGITSVREMNGSPTHLRLRENIALGDVLGPRVLVSSPLITGRELRFRHELVEDPVRVADLIAQLANEAYDYIKIYDDLSLDSYAAIVESASQHSISLAGHIPESVGLKGVLSAGQMLEHNEKIVVDVLGYDFSDLSGLENAAQAISESGVSVTPTLAVHEFMSDRRNPEIALRMTAEELAYVDDDILMWWRSVFESENGRELHEQDSVVPPFLAAQRRLVRELAKRGVPILVGTDTPNPLMIPGFSLHDELAALVRAGLTPMDAIRSATLVPGQQLAWTARIGKVEVGYAADVILIDGDPLVDLSLLRRPSAVITNGIWLDRRAIDAMLQQALRR